MEEKLLPQGYFDHVQKAMVREGFTLISFVPINTTECHYHVPVRIASATSMFFHKRGKAFIVMLRYIESLDKEDGHHSGHWSISLYLRFLSYGELLNQNPRWLGKSTMNEGDGSGLYHDMPVLGSTKLEIEGFRYCTGLGLEMSTRNEQVGLRYEEECAGHQRAIDAEALAWRVTNEVYLVVEKYLDQGPFENTSIFDFVPHYVFSGESGLERDKETLERVFWSKFDLKYLHGLIIRPRGYNFHRTDRRVAA